MQDRQRAKRGGGALHPTFLGQHCEMHSLLPRTHLLLPGPGESIAGLQPARPLSVKRRDCALSMHDSNYPSPSPASHWTD